VTSLTFLHYSLVIFCEQLLICYSCAAFYCARFKPAFSVQQYQQVSENFADNVRISVRFSRKAYGKLYTLLASGLTERPVELYGTPFNVEFHLEKGSLLKLAEQIEAELKEKYAPQSAK